MPIIDSPTHFHAVHDHSHMPQDRLDDIAAYCKIKGLRFTPLRQKIYELIVLAKKPVGAYELLDKLATERKRAAPPTVYRSLEFLLEHGFVHRLATTNTYIPCCHPRQPHQAAFLICENCHSVQEFSKEPLFSELQELINKDGFVVKESVIEITGLCQSCQ